jgi:hypothetical protein
MNIRRGLFRAWLIASAVWVGLRAWHYAFNTCLLGCKHPEIVIYAPRWDEAITNIIAGPIAIVLVGYAILWIVQGFSAKGSN